MSETSFSQEQFASETGFSQDQVSAVPTLIPQTHQEHREERANVITHGLGAVLSIIGGITLAVVGFLHRQSAAVLVCCLIFSLTMVMMFLSSTLFHSATRENWKKRLQIVDHICIYLLIAGSYTPFAVLGMSRSWAWGILSFAWSFAVIGIALKILVKRRYQLLETLLYLVMGWGGMIGIVPLYYGLPWVGFVLLVMGGVFYTVGTLFYMKEHWPYNHAVWHLFVIAGCGCHFFGVYYALLG